MKGKPITFWANEQEEKRLKDMAKSQHRSVSNFIKTKCGIFEDE